MLELAELSGLEAELDSHVRAFVYNNFEDILNCVCSQDVFSA